MLANASLLRTTSTTTTTTTPLKKTKTPTPQSSTVSSTRSSSVVNGSAGRRRRVARKEEFDLTVHDLATLKLTPTQRRIRDEAREDSTRYIQTRRSLRPPALSVTISPSVPAAKTTMMTTTTTDRDSTVPPPREEDPNVKDFEEEVRVWARASAAVRRRRGGGSPDHHRGDTDSDDGKGGGRRHRHERPQEEQPEFTSRRAGKVRFTTQVLDDILPRRELRDLVRGVRALTASLLGSNDDEKRHDQDATDRDDDAVVRLLGHLIGSGRELVEASTTHVSATRRSVGGMIATMEAAAKRIEAAEARIRSLEDELAVKDETILRLQREVKEVSVFAGEEIGILRDQLEAVLKDISVLALAASRATSLK